MVWPPSSRQLEHLSEEWRPPEGEQWPDEDVTARLFEADDHSLASSMPPQPCDLHGMPFALLPVVLEKMPIACVLLGGSDFVYRYVNPAMERIFGFSREELLGKTPYTTIVRPDDAHKVEARRRSIEAGEHHARATYRNCTKDGRILWCRWDSTVIYDQTGTLVAYLAMAEDITQQRAEGNARRAAEAALHASEARAAAMIATTPDAILTFDDRHVVAEANPAAARLFQCSQSALVGRDMRTLFAPAPIEESPLRSSDPASVRDPLALGSRDGCALRPDDTWIPVRIAVGKADLAHGKMYTAILHDLSERMLLEQRLQQAAKMEAMGKLAGGVAHDFNNLLTVINGYAAELLGELPEGELAREFVKEIGDAGARAATLTRQLLTMARSRTPLRGHVSLNEVVRAMTKMLGRLIGEDVHLVTDLEDPIVNVEGDVGQLEQVLLNLVVNARDAMPSGGDLFVTTRTVQVDGSAPAPTVSLGALLPPGLYACLTVTDNGAGMSEFVRSRIFEPFFTTKDSARGTGLGLAMVVGIVSQSGGHIGVDTSEGHGTQFRIYLPATAPLSQPSARSPSLPSVGDARGDEVVLLAEDDESVRALARFALESRGYTVLEARDGESAAILAKNHAGPIHLLVTDMVMPGLAGPALGEAVRVDRPDLKVLYCSGYGSSHPRKEGDEFALEPPLPADAAVLPKPFTPSELATRVRHLLDGQSQTS